MTLKSTSRFSKFLVAAAATTALMVPVAGGTTPAEASATNSGPPGQSWSTVVCNSYEDTVRISIAASVQSGYFRGQWIEFRYYLANDRGGVWTPWNRRFVNYNNYRGTSLMDLTTRAADRNNYYVYTEVRWWNGSTWSAPQGKWAQRGQAGYYFVSYKNGCAT